MPNFDFKQINDPIHGSIHLSELETQIISTAVFQRLHNIKQLGLGVLVYPSANYSRFSHSIGACHLAGRIVDSINKNLPSGSSKRIDDDQKQMYRLGGLLHDIGHYPFSHTFEHVVENFYKGSFLQDENDTSSVSTATRSLDHEALGKKIIKHDSELQKIFSDNQIDVDQFSKVFNQEDPEFLTEILSSDLDCDRLDYLMRTAHHAGLPYGHVDVNYLVHNMDIDEKDSLCLRRRALRAADHMLVSRYYDYMQLPFHKSVVAFELSLQKVVEYLLKKTLINCSADELADDIKSGKWKHFDDQKLMSLIRENSPTDLTEVKHFDAILNRQQPKQVFCRDVVEDKPTDDEERREKDFLALLESTITELSERYSIERELWHVWSPTLSITKCGRTVKIGEAENNGVTEGEKAQLVKIKGIDKNDPGASKLLIACENTLVSSLSEKVFRGLRVYVNLAHQENPVKLRQEIEAKFRQKIKTAQT